ncbi:hypothetical protein VPH35_033618 [Triticum aestivum]
MPGRWVTCCFECLKCSTDPCTGRSKSTVSRLKGWMVDRTRHGHPQGICWNMCSLAVVTEAALNAPRVVCSARYLYPYLLYI